MMAMRAATPASRASGSIPRSTTTSTSRSTRPTCGSTPTGFGRGRAARQHDRQRGSHHPHSDRHRRRLPERAFPAQEPRLGVEQLKARLYEAELQKREAEARPASCQDRYRLGSPDPLLRPAALSDGQRPADRGHLDLARATCSTASSTASWPLPCHSGSPAKRSRSRMWSKSSARARCSLLAACRAQPTEPQFPSRPAGRADRRRHLLDRGRARPRSARPRR